MSSAPTVETCTNCERMIGKLERAYLYQGQVVCERCYSRLSGIVKGTDDDPPRKDENDDERVLYKAHPTMLGEAPILFVCSIVLIACGVGLIILLVWWLHCQGRELRITDKRTILHEGILSKSENEIFHSDVRNIQVRQTFLQRLLKVEAGTIGISSAGQSGIEIRISGMPDPYQVRQLIDQNRQSSA